MTLKERAEAAELENLRLKRKLNALFNEYRKVCAQVIKLNIQLENYQAAATELLSNFSSLVERTELADLKIIKNKKEEI